MPRAMPARLRSRLRSPALSGLVTVIRLLPAVSRLRTFLLAVGIAATTVLPITATVVGGTLVGSIPPAVRGGVASQAAHATLALLAGMAGLLVAVRVLSPFVTAIAESLGRSVDLALQELVMVAVNRPEGISHLEDPAILDLIQTAQGVGTAINRPGLAVASLASLLPSWFQALGSALLLLTFRWPLGLLWLVVWPAILYYLQRDFVRVGQAVYNQANRVRRSAYLNDLTMTPGAAKELRIWAMVDWLADRYHAEWLRAMRPIRAVRHPARPTTWLPGAVMVAINLVSYGALAWAASHGDLGLGGLAVYTQALAGANSFRAFGNDNAIVALGAVAVPSVLQAGERLRPARDPAARPVQPARSPVKAIRFHGVAFRYARATADTLHDLDLTIPAGRSLAVVGANGAGKTTLVKLLCRLCEPTSGHVSVDGVDLASMDPAAWRRGLAAVFQDFAHYDLSARDNVALGAPELARDTDRLNDVARRAGALEVIEALPAGWDTVLSRQYRGGTDLSGGQWQRIALARALLAVDAGARLLILDEPTANLDVRSEAALYDHLLAIASGLTTILISHRFSTVRRSDTICVLDDGRVREEGTHDELMAMRGRYAAMFELQAARFTNGEAGAE
jgi:ATP-binding cassette, subfamily B, bacterial